MPVSPFRFPASFGLLLLILFLAFPASLPAFAQQPAAPAAAEPTEDVTRPLLDVLKDDAARAKLIESLEKSAGVASPNAAPKHRKTVIDGLAIVTKGAITEAVSVGRRFFGDISGIAALFSSHPGERADFSAMFGPLLLTIAASLAIAYGARWVLRRAAGHVARRIDGSDLVDAIAHVAAYFIAEALALALAYFGAGALAVSLFGSSGVSIVETLYLNAFLVFGVVAIFVRLLTGIVHGDYPLLRFSPDMRGQIRWRGIVLAGILVYGIAFVVPAINNVVSFTAGRGLRVIIYTLAALFAVWAIRAVSATQRAESVDPTASREETDEAIAEAAPPPVNSIVHRIWPPIGYLYVAASYVIALSRPDIFIGFVGGATLKTVLALVAGSLVMRLFGYLTTLNVRTPDFLPIDGPALSERLTSIAPFFLRALWLVVGVAVLGAILDAWAIFDVRGWITGDSGGDLIDGIVSALIVLLVVAFVWAVTTSWIDHRMRTAKVPAHQQARHHTLYSLLGSAVTVALLIFGGMIALSELGVDIGPLLAGAGVLGLAIGFGSQKLVQDIISGIFIQLENAMNVGDVVSAGSITGTVERLTLRSVALRDLAGVYHIIPFSSVDMVSNFMRLFSYHVEELRLAYKENVADGKAAMQEAFDRLMKTEHGQHILAPLEMHGVTALSESAVLLRARIKTAPGQQFGAGRAYTELVKEVMDEQNIEIPYPYTTLVLGRDKQGRPDEIAIDIKPANGGQTEPDENT